MIFAQLPDVNNPWMAMAAMGFFALQAWQLWIGYKAKAAGESNATSLGEVKSSVGDVHLLVNSQRATLEDRLALAETRLADAVSKIEILSGAAEYRRGQDAGPSPAPGPAPEIPFAGGKDGHP